MRKDIVNRIGRNLEIAKERRDGSTLSSIGRRHGGLSKERVRSIVLEVERHKRHMPYNLWTLEFRLMAWQSGLCSRTRMGQIEQQEWHAFWKTLQADANA